ncbi:MAG: carboxypeptidase-like regulatory domain-containing protein [Chitinophagaceae bacterium]
MKPKILLLAVSLLGFVIARANTVEEGTGKKDDLNGTVIDSENKKPLKDVTVTAYLVTKKEKVAWSDESGNFGFDELKPGTYKFIFEKAGYKKITKEKVVIRTDEAFQMNIEMIENPDFDLLPSPFHFSDFK